MTSFQLTMLSLSESRTRKRCLEYSAASPEKKTFISRYFRTNKHLMIICELQGEDQISQSISVFSSYCGASGGRNTQLNWPQRPSRPLESVKLRQKLVEPTSFNNQPPSIKTADVYWTQTDIQTRLHGKMKQVTWKNCDIFSLKFFLS